MEITKKKIINMVGMKFGKLTVLAYEGLEEHGSALWKCRCDCGNTCVVKRPYLTSTCKMPSCGCMAWSGNRKPDKRQGTGTYQTWKAMRDRCMNPNGNGYADYGGRGIKICADWDNYDNFLRDMGDRPWGMTIERINNEGDYEKANCKWATRKAQTRNRRSNHMLTINGVTKCLREWDQQMGFKPGTVSDRLRYGFPAERLLEPVRVKVKKSTLQSPTPPIR